MGQLKSILFLLCLSFNAHALTNSHAAMQKFSTFNVYISGPGLALNGEDFPVYCNGSLIADDLVVTAAHCLASSMHDLDSVRVSVGDYKNKQGKPSQNYYIDLDVIKIKKIYYPNLIDKKARQRLLTKVDAISAHNDVVLIELERPIDRNKVDVQIIDFITPKEHKQISDNIKKYSFVVVSTNPVTEVTTSQTKRYAYFNNMSIDGILNKFYSKPILSSDRNSKVEGYDSGAPLLVNINKEWKLLGVVKGFMTNALSTKINDTMVGAGYEVPKVELTPEKSAFTPVAFKMCELLKRANRSCN